MIIKCHFCDYVFSTSVFPGETKCPFCFQQLQFDISISFRGKPRIIRKYKERTYYSPEERIENEKRIC